MSWRAEEKIGFFIDLYAVNIIYYLFIGDLTKEKKVLQWLIDQKSKNPHPFLQ